MLCVSLDSLDRIHQTAVSSAQLQWSRREQISYSMCVLAVLRKPAEANCRKGTTLAGLGVAHRHSHHRWSRMLRPPRPRSACWRAVTGKNHPARLHRRPRPKGPPPAQDALPLWAGRCRVQREGVGKQCGSKRQNHVPLILISVLLLPAIECSQNRRPAGGEK